MIWICTCFDNLITTFPFCSTKENGEVDRINYNNQVRHTSLDIPLSDVKPLYDALKLFDDLCYQSDNHVKIKLESGMC